MDETFSITEDFSVALFSNDSLVAETFFEQKTDSAVSFIVFIRFTVFTLCWLLQIRAKARPADEALRRQNEADREKEKNKEKALSRDDLQFAQQFECLDTAQEMRKVTAAHSSKGSATKEAVEAE